MHIAPILALRRRPIDSGPDYGAIKEDVHVLACALSLAQVPAGNRRDLRLDLFRGLSLFMICFDHIHHSFLSHLTVRNFFYFDAAEIFVFISGYTGAIVYGRSMQQHGVIVTSVRVYRRVIQIYIANTVLCLTSLALLVMISGNPHSAGFGANILDALFLNSPVQMGHILPLYMVLLTFLPAALYLLRRHSLLPGILSAILYGLTLGLGWKFYPTPLHDAFNVLAWQFLFVIGVSLGNLQLRKPGPISIPAWLLKLAVFAAMLFSACHIYAIGAPIFGLAPPGALAVDKTDLSVFRLVNFLAVAIVVVHLVKLENVYLRHLALRPIILCGQHSLPIFCLGVLLSVIVQFAFTRFGANPGIQAVASLGVVTIMFSAAFLLEVLHRARRNPQLRPGMIRSAADLAIRLCS
jgi:hypothetical protein